MLNGLRADIGESLCKNGRRGTRVQEKENKPWLSQETWALIDQRKVIKQKLISARSARLKQRWQDEYQQKDREIKRQVRVD